MEPIHEKYQIAPGKPLLPWVQDLVAGILSAENGFFFREV
jgi:hypothetical protein